ncbi:glycosyltransferase family protein [Granulosicoccus sp. 3-233]|uniref:glycosyltransferase family protein n=1 Tax=Granulosicoccus sp. 3-233 TaxID=3417969 RepID=UPI003D345E2E
MSRRPRASRILFHVQHLLGIGHLMRAGRIAEALAGRGMDVTLVSGGLPVKGFSPVGVRRLELPAMAVGTKNFGELVDADGQVLDDAYRQRRSALLLQMFHDIEPDCVILEAFPFGRRQLRFELLPLIEAIESRQNRPVLLTSVRDILQRRTKPGRDEETASLITRHFDGVLVHGDPQFATLDESFSCAATIADRISYTGLVCAPLAEPSPLQVDIVVSAGGGAVGDRLVKAALQAAGELPSELSWCIIGGPNLQQAHYASMARELPDNVLLERFRADFPGLLRNARVSVSQAGYNTMGDILQAGCRAILVPYSVGGETEQADRAARLQELGLAEVLAEDQLSSATLAALIRQVLSGDDAAAAARPGLDTRGAAQTAEIVQSLITTGARQA